MKKNQVFDRISCIRYAIENCRVIDAEFICLEEYPASPLEMELMKKASGGNVKTIGIRELFEKESGKIHISQIRKCYGAANEVETILTEIYARSSENAPYLDRCTVVITDPGTYSQLFFDYALIYDIPVTFGCGIPIVNANPAKLLVDYYYWMTGGFFGEEALNRMLNSGVFNRKAFYREISETGDETKKNRFFCDL